LLVFIGLLSLLTLAIYPGYSEISLVTNGIGESYNMSNKEVPASVRILVIDDEPAILRFLDLCFSRLGYLADLAENGVDGIRKIESISYDIILTDVKMPGLSGKNVSNYIRNVKRSSTPVVGMSGTPWLLDDHQFDAVLEKPFSKELLLETIHGLLLR